MQPKEKGGLGVINLKLQNDALLLKNLDKFYNKKDIPWVQLIWWKHYQNKVPHASREVGSFWWKDILRLSNLFRSIARCTIRDGSTVLFWDDEWSQHVLSEQYPRLVTFAKNTRASVRHLLQEENLQDSFDLPLSQEAFTEFEDLQQQLQNLDLSQLNNADVWLYTWGGMAYSSRKLNKLAFNDVGAHSAYKWIWKAQCTPRIKFFAWLIVVDRLNTKEMLKRRHIRPQDEDEACVLCDSGATEDLEHLFFTCNFARQCWQRLQIDWNINIDIFQRMAQSKQNSNLPFFMELVLIAAWEIWRSRNDKIFWDKVPSFNVWLVNLKSQCSIQSVRFRGVLRSSFCAWLDAFN